ncbi:hypothetical protein CB0940_01461 [Cercospora beticola]|uniref:BRCT domain-containing protein n=1 Tax=Cercospora beticola TaxID=122368 RepID=A0A2G5ID65_CERBT|nr:hypothetical protein CB0940_01461 [Cercospora beticola]PIB02423.1 hypothetical protein CB0940_01461 [Cercospora beticola]WPA96899.1 hypothetical protein RHO25_001507 [Cercospora beticola]
MVSTRGGARTSAGDTVATLKKKPARKPATAAAKPATTQTTRTRKTVPETGRISSAELREDDELDELAAPAPPPVKGIRKGRLATVENDVPAEKAATKKATRPGATTKTTAKKVTQPTASRTSKTTQAAKQTTDIVEPRDAPQLKPTQSRATRPTRATAAKEKAAPLSPKKITQVLKPKVATTKTTVNKAAAPAKPAARPVARKRNVSDENADVAGLASAIDGADRTSRAPKRRNTREGAATATKIEIDAAPTKSATSADPAQRVLKPRDDVLQDDGNSELREDQEGQQVSDDELCAPKTPMRRCDRQEHSHLCTAQAEPLANTSVALETPVRRFQVLGTQRGTPQTQRPYFKQNVQTLEIRPMTVARARDTAMVFPKLQPLPHLSIPNHSDALQNHLEPRISDQSLHSASDHKPEQETNSPSPLVDAEMRDGTLHESHSQHEHGDLSEPQSAALSQTPDHGRMDEAMGGERSTLPHDTSFGLEPSMATIAFGTPSIVASRSSSLGEDAIEQPETIDWNNLREDNTSLFELENDMTLFQGLPQAEPTERLIIPAALRDNSHITCEEEQTTAQLAEVGNDSTTDLSESTPSVAKQCDSPEQTVNISDFLETTSLVAHREEVLEPSQGAVIAQRPEIEELVEDDTMVDGDVTLMCDETDLNRAVATTPFKIATAEEVEEEDGEIQGDDTLIIEELEYSSSAARSPIKLVTAEDSIEEEEDAGMEGDNTLILDEAVFSPKTARSPIKLVTAEDSLEEDRDTVEGDITLSLEESSCPRTTTHSPIKLATIEDFPEEQEGVEGDLTLALSSPLPQQLETPALTLEGGGFEDKFRNLDKSGTPRCAETTPMSAEAAESSSGFAIEIDHDLLGKSSKNRMSPHARLSTPSGTGSVFHGTPLVPSHNHSPQRSPFQEQATPAYVPMQTASSLKRKSLHDTTDTSHSMATTPKRTRSSWSPEVSRSPQTVKSAVLASRSLTPARRSPNKQPATAQKPNSLRKIALKATSTPMRTISKASTSTPSEVAMTPHPSAPLRGVVALVDVYTHDGACVSQSFAMLLRRLGAKTTKTFNDNVTHVVFKEGNPKLIEALTSYNAQIANEGTGKEIYCVNSRWVNDCDAQGHRVAETDEEYVVEVDEYPRSTKRRRKSMEPSTLLKTNGGNIIRDRRTSNGRLSIGRASMKGIFDHSDETSLIGTPDKENSEDGSEPATPAYLKAPSSLVQQTMPAKRVRKLNLSAKADTQRRLTFANGLEL